MSAPLSSEEFQERLNAAKERLAAAGYPVPTEVSETVSAMDEDERTALCIRGIDAAKVALRCRLRLAAVQPAHAAGPVQPAPAVQAACAAEPRGP